MNRLVQYILMLKVAYLIKQMPMGQGWTKASDYQQWTNLSRSTVYRYLIAMVEHGLLEPKVHTRGRRTFAEYRITDAGLKLYESQKELFAW